MLFFDTLHPLIITHWVLFLMRRTEKARGLSRYAVSHCDGPNQSANRVDACRLHYLPKGIPTLPGRKALRGGWELIGLIFQPRLCLRIRSIHCGIFFIAGCSSQ
jgi:hypothetical protein